jgi:lipopolysaccharide transport system ATP-binding protein
MSSNTVAISVRGLGKKYTIFHNSTRPTSLREAILQHLRHPFGNGQQERETFWALRNVDFEIRQGEIVGIIGRNGAGKSTLLKLLTRITGPTTGTIDIHGRMASLLEVGTGFHPELTGRENIYLNGSILGMSRRDITRKFDEIVAFAEIENFLDTPVKRYSSGMYIRLAFAVAAHLTPEILIVDEVLAVGDAAFQKKCLGKMKAVSASGGRTVLFVSHNLTTIRALCSRAIWLKQGRMIQDGPPGPVIEKYLGEILGEDRDFYDLENIDRPTGQETPVRLCRLSFNDGTPIRHGVPLLIDVEYKVLADVDGVAFGVGFSSLDGSRIMSSDSDIPGECLTISKGTRGRVRFTVPELHLQPGRYFLDIAARSGVNHSLDYIPGFAQVEVLPGPDTPTVIVGRDVSGGVRVPAICQHFLSPDLQFSPPLNYIVKG